jgi:Predicted transcriptional regulator
MKILRDLRLNTKLLILLEITIVSHSKLKPIADRLGITVQGISEYMKIMQSEGLVHITGGGYKATKKGVQFLHENIRDLKEFVERTMKKLEVIDLCAAIAKTRIKEGERVGLFMENGILTAYSNRSSGSMGTAMFDAGVGEDLGIKDLEGVIELLPGKLCIIELPMIEEGGTHKIDTKKAKSLTFKPDRIGALDIVGLSFINELNLKCDFEFAPMNSTIEAVQRGMNVMVAGSAESVHKMILAIDEINSASSDKIEYTLLFLGSST